MPDLTGHQILSHTLHNSQIPSTLKTTLLCSYHNFFLFLSSIFLLESLSLSYERILKFDQICANCIFDQTKRSLLLSNCKMLRNCNKTHKCFVKSGRKFAKPLETVANFVLCKHFPREVAKTFSVL